MTITRCSESPFIVMGQIDTMEHWGDSVPLWHLFQKCIAWHWSQVNIRQAHIQGHRAKAGLYSFKNIKRLRNSFRLKHTKETWQLNAAHDPGLDAGLENCILKGIVWTFGKFWIRSVGKISWWFCMDVSFTSSVTTLWLSKSMSLFLGNTLGTSGISRLQFTLEAVQNKKDVLRRGSIVWSLLPPPY